MEIQFTGKNVKVSQTSKNYIERKLDKIVRGLPTVLETKVDITKQKVRPANKRYRVQVTIDSNGTLLRGDETDGTLYGAINTIVETMERQAERFRNKLHHPYKQRKAQRSPSPRIPPAEAESEVELEEATSGLPEGVVKVKRFEVKPMSLLEARDQMELLAHDFFLFLNDESGDFNLLYRRKDGNFGLIEPKMA